MLFGIGIFFSVSCPTKLCFKQCQFRAFFTSFKYVKSTQSTFSSYAMLMKKEFLFCCNQTAQSKRDRNGTEPFNQSRFALTPFPSLQQTADDDRQSYVEQGNDRSDPRNYCALACGLLRLRSSRCSNSCRFFHRACRDGVFPWAAFACAYVARRVSAVVDPLLAPAVPVLLEHEGEPRFSVACR